MLVASASTSPRLPTEGPFFPPESSAITITNIASQALIAEMLETVRSHFAHPTSEYLGVDAEDYRAIVAAAQNDLNQRSLTRRLASDRIDLLADVLATKKILIQRNLHLRATRPQIKSLQENVGWHRESFYGAGVERCVNFWAPIANVTAENTLRYVSDSHLIPEDRIETVRIEDPTTPKFSAGHKIGLNYAPKQIVSGVDFSKQRAFDVSVGQAAVFSGALIHGAAENRSNNIRFSIDFRLIAQEAYGGRALLVGGNDNYYEPL
jgi:ectoine hydroxylase-related dioxygenase (phytanoyl-CoA dioxygenase family)